MTEEIATYNQGGGGGGGGSASGIDLLSAKKFSHGEVRRIVVVAHRVRIEGEG